MKKIVYPLLTLVLSGLSSFGQVDTSLYPTGQIRVVKLFQGDKIIQAKTYKNDGQVKYQWDIKKRELISFDAVYDNDTLIDYFINNCASYTLYQHYGNGPISKIENYQAGKRHGLSQYFDRDGRLISVGSFENWEKVGIWAYYDIRGREDLHIHWFHHGFDGGGISINYTIVPVSISLLLIVIFLLFNLYHYSFSIFFNSYSFVTIGLYISLYIFGSLANEEVIKTIKASVGIYLFPIITTFTLVNAALALTALIFNKLTMVKRRFSLLFLMISLVQCLLLLDVYLGSKLVGAVM